MEVLEIHPLPIITLPVVLCYMDRLRLIHPFDKYLLNTYNFLDMVMK